LRKIKAVNKNICKLNVCGISEKSRFTRLVCPKHRSVDQQKYLLFAKLLPAFMMQTIIYNKAFFSLRTKTGRSYQKFHRHLNNSYFKSRARNRRPILTNCHNLNLQRLLTCTGLEKVAQSLCVMIGNHSIYYLPCNTS